MGWVVGVVTAGDYATIRKREMRRMKTKTFYLWADKRAGITSNRHTTQISDTTNQPQQHFLADILVRHILFDVSFLPSCLYQLIVTVLLSPLHCLTPHFPFRFSVSARNMIQTMMDDVARIQNSRGSHTQQGKGPNNANNAATAAAAALQLTKKGSNNSLLGAKANGAKKTHGVAKTSGGIPTAASSSSSSSGHAKKSAAGIVAAAQGQGPGPNAQGQGLGPKAAGGKGFKGVNKGGQQGGGHAKESMLDQVSRLISENQHTHLVHC